MMMESYSNWAEIKNKKSKTRTKSEHVKIPKTKRDIIPILMHMSPSRGQLLVKGSKYKRNKFTGVNVK